MFLQVNHHILIYSRSTLCVFSISSCRILETHALNGIGVIIIILLYLLRIFLSKIKKNFPP